MWKMALGGVWGSLGLERSGIGGGWGGRGRSKEKKGGEKKPNNPNLESGENYFKGFNVRPLYAKENLEY